nr:ER membrane protein complex subunit 4 isoform X1 [Rattus norvegicus]
MTTQGGLVANRGRRFKWAIELSGPGGGSRGRSDRGSGQGDSLYPVGYLDKQVPDTSVQETDRILVEKLGTEPRALRFLGKRSTTELNPQPLMTVF